MKKLLTKVLSITAMAACFTGTALTATSCGKTNTKHHIGIMLYKDTGDDVEALKAYTNSLKGPLNMEFTFVTGSLTNQEQNLNAIKDLQLKGCEGIVVSLCGDTFPAFVDAAAEGETPIASYYGVPEDYYYYDGGNTGGGIKSDKSKENMRKWYVGGVEDGVRTGDKGGEYLGNNYFENVVISGGKRKIGLMHFNFTYYPKQLAACDTFISKVNAWNADASHADDKITLYDVVANEDGTYKTSVDFPGKYPGDASVANTSGNLGYSLGFSPLADEYFAGTTHDGMDTIACFGAAGTFVYPKLAGKNKNIQVYGSGYDSGSKGFSDDFGENGEKIMQQSTFSNVESFVYPLVMLSNKIDKKEYADNYVQKGSTNIYLDSDVTDRRVSSYYNYITSNEELNYVTQHSMYATHKASDAVLSAEQIKNLMTRYNDKATYDDLLKTVQSLKYRA